MSPEAPPIQPPPVSEPKPVTSAEAAAAFEREMNRPPGSPSILSEQEVARMVKIGDIVSAYNKGVEDRKKERNATLKENQARAKSRVAEKFFSEKFMGGKLGPLFSKLSGSYTKNKKGFSVAGKDPIENAQAAAWGGIGVMLASPLAGPLAPLVYVKGLRDSFVGFAEWRMRRKDQKGDNYLNEDLAKNLANTIGESLKSNLEFLKGELERKAITPDQYYVLVQGTIADHQQWQSRDLFPREQKTAEAQNSLQRMKGKAGKLAVVLSSPVALLNPLVGIPALAATWLHADAEAHSQRGIVPKDATDFANYSLGNPIPESSPEEAMRKIEDDHSSPVTPDTFTESAKGDHQPALTRQLASQYPELAPTSNIEVGGRTFLLGPTFADPSGMVFSIFYVQQKNGELIARLARRDAINGVWHVVEHLEDKSAQGKGKGGQQKKVSFAVPRNLFHPIEETRLPKEISGQLEQVELGSSEEAGLNPEEAQTLLKQHFCQRPGKVDRSDARKAKPAENASYRSEVKHFDDGGLLKRLREIRPNNLQPFDPERPREAGVRPELGVNGLVQQVNSLFEENPGFMPDFSKDPVSTHVREHPFLGAVRVEVYHGALNGQSIAWEMASDREGRVWIDGLRLVDDQTTSYGVPSTVIDAGFLTINPIVDTAAGKYDLIKPYMRNVAGSRRKELQDCSRFLDEFSPITTYRWLREITREPDSPEVTGRVEKKNSDRPEQDGVGGKPTNSSPPPPATVLPKPPVTEVAAKGQPGDLGGELVAGSLEEKPEYLTPSTQDLVEPTRELVGIEESSSEDVEDVAGEPADPPVGSPPLAEAKTGRKAYELGELSGKDLFERLKDLNKDSAYPHRRLLAARLNSLFTVMQGKKGGRPGFRQELADRADALRAYPDGAAELTAVRDMLIDPAVVAAVVAQSFRVRELRDKPELRQSLIVRGLGQFGYIVKGVRQGLPYNSPVRNAYHALAEQIDALLNRYKADGNTDIADTPEKVVEHLLEYRRTAGIDGSSAQVERPKPTPTAVLPTAPVNTGAPAATVPAESIQEPKPPAIRPASEVEPQTPASVQLEEQAQVIVPPTPAQPSMPGRVPIPEKPAVFLEPTKLRLENPLAGEGLSPMEKGLRDKARQYFEAQTSIPKILRDLAPGENANTAPQVSFEELTGALQSLCQRVTGQKNRQFTIQDIPRVLRVAALGIEAIPAQKRLIGIHDESGRIVLAVASQYESMTPANPTETAPTSQGGHVQPGVRDIEDSGV